MVQSREQESTLQATSQSAQQSTSQTCNQDYTLVSEEPRIVAPHEQNTSCPPLPSPCAASTQQTVTEIYKPLRLQTMSSCISQPDNVQPIEQSKPSTGSRAAQYLGLLRAHLQAEINKEIKKVIDKYREQFFQPALQNIRSRLGVGNALDSTLEEQERAVYQRALEEAKKMFRLPAPYADRHVDSGWMSKHQDWDSGVGPGPDDTSGSGGTRGPSVEAVRPQANSNSQRKRPHRSTQNRHNRGTGSQGAGVALVGAPRAPAPAPAVAEVTAPQEEAVTNSPVAHSHLQAGLGTGAAAGVVTASRVREAPVLSIPQVFRKRKETETETPRKRRNRQPPAPACFGTQARMANPASKRVTQGVQTYASPFPKINNKRDPARVTADTLLIMGARAHKVLGFRHNRGSLFSRHLNLFKYAGDQEDKDWLVKNNLMPPTAGKFFMCVMQDVHELALSVEYRNNPNVKLHELKGFRAPEFMLQKIRSCMRSSRLDVSSPLGVKVAPVHVHAVDRVVAASCSTSPAIPGVRISSGSMLTTLPPSLEALATSGSKPSHRVSTSSMTPLSVCLPPTQPVEVDELSLNPSLDELEMYINDADPTTGSLQQDETEATNTIMLSVMNSQEDEFPNIMSVAAEPESLDTTLDSSVLNLDVNLGVNLEPETATWSWTLVGDDGLLIAPVPSPVPSSVPSISPSPSISSVPSVMPSCVTSPVPSSVPSPMPDPDPESCCPTSSSTVEEANTGPGVSTLALSHATLTALLTGSNRMEGLEIPEGLL